MTAAVRQGRTLGLRSTQFGHRWVDDCVDIVMAVRRAVVDLVRAGNHQSSDSVAGEYSRHIADQTGTR